MADLGFAFGFGADAVGAQRLLNGPVDRVHRVQGAIGILEDRLNAAPEAEELFALEVGHILPIEQHPASGGLKKPQHDIGHR